MKKFKLGTNVQVERNYCTLSVAVSYALYAKTKENARRAKLLRRIKKNAKHNKNGG